uniref:Uncharacterized protein n=1 Tax=Ditylenchus dipsaci TaxID=166011 RepID=A0A915DTE8_9BILA
MGCRLSRTFSNQDIANPATPNNTAFGTGIANKRSSISSSGSGADLAPAPAVCCNPSASPHLTKPNGGQLDGADRRMTNGQSVLHRRDTPAQLSPKPSSPTKQGNVPPTSGTPLNGINEQSSPIMSSFKSAEMVPNIGCAKPICQTESASQADFFRLLDEKIAQGAKHLQSVDSEEEK